MTAQPLAADFTTAEASPRPAYRRDIDGLRALAILPVLLYHARAPGLGGGYVGVDVFFVISGYLITGILLREIDGGTFSIARFYQRRARRILPALFAVVAFVLAVAAWLYLPGDFEGVPKSALATLLFAGNAWFFTQTGYFSGGSETMPLLHGWSLAVEEQFYIAFPLLLWGLARAGARLRLAVVALGCAASFALAVATQDKGDGFAFYLLPARAWELGAGALLAMGAVPEIRQRMAREVLACSGLALILAAVLLYDRNTVFPGLAALPPVLGAVLLIHAAPGTLAGRALSAPLFVGLGLVSYSLYLWHWPLFVFADYAGVPFEGAGRIGLIALALGLAWLSWRFIERPFRDNGLVSDARVLPLAGLGLAGLAALSAALIPLGGWAARFPPEVTRIMAARADHSPARAACLTDAVGGDRPECTLGAKVPPSVLVWGDSHAVELAWALGEELGREGRALMQRTRGSCPPVIGYAVASDPGCARFNAEVLERIAATPSLETVWLAGFWGSERYDRPGKVEQLAQTIAHIRATGRRVVLVGPVPRQSFDVPHHLASAAAAGEPLPSLGAPMAEATGTARWFHAGLPAFRAAGAQVLDPARALAQQGRSRIRDGEAVLFFDSHHLTLAGARRVLAADPTR